MVFQRRDQVCRRSKILNIWKFKIFQYIFSISNLQHCYILTQDNILDKTLFHTENTEFHIVLDLLEEFLKDSLDFFVANLINIYQSLLMEMRVMSSIIWRENKEHWGWVSSWDPLDNTAGECGLVEGRGSHAVFIKASYLPLWRTQIFLLRFYNLSS